MGMRVLVTGATGKVGQHLLPALRAKYPGSALELVLLCNNRVPEDAPHQTIVRGSISDRAVVREAMRNVTHIIHMSAVKENPDLAMDVSVKGMFWMLEEFRAAPTGEQFILIGGDCSVGHILQHYDAPITEDSPRKPYPGCYALSKVLEETMLEQYYIQYGLNGCCLRAPWIMEKDDFKYAMTFGPDQFGGPAWNDLLSEHEIARYAKENRVPLLLDHDGQPLKRSFVHVSDLVSAIVAALDNPKAHQQLFNVSMNAPVEYAKIADHLEKTRGLKPVKINSNFYSNWLSNSKARLLLDWEPKVELTELIEESYTFQRDASDPRKIWYVG